MNHSLRSGISHGFTLLEIIVATGISFIIMMVIYEAFIVSKNFFDKGTDLVNEENLIKILFGKMTMDFQFASRINYISSTRDSIEVDIFKDKVLIQIPLLMIS